ncbi:MAG: acyltransferase, partial [Pseudolabrys sp.]|nr:acyltransferase [Pseudolabrys sp.]
LFFAISGFIMVATSAKSFGVPNAPADFMRRRIIRIVPLYWLVTTVALAAALVAPSLMKVPGNSIEYILGSYLFWPLVRLTGEVRPLATPGWTLNLEMFFYVVFAVALAFRPRVGFTVLFATLGGLVAARVAGVLPGVALNFWGDPIVINFLFGAAIGIVYNKGVRLPAGWSLALTTVGFGMLFLHLVPPGAQDDFWPRIVDGIPSVVVLFAVALGPQINESARAWRLPLSIGDASYSLYLVHEFLLRPLFLLWKKGPIDTLTLWSFIPVGIAISVVAALLTYRYFERPMTRWLNGQGTPKAALAFWRRRPFTAAQEFP